MTLENKINKIATAIRLHGKKSGSDYILSLSKFNVITDGTIAEEYEELDKAPCRINYLGISSDQTQPWFNMQAAFSTHFALVWGDKYNLSAANNSAIDKIYHYTQNLKPIEQVKNKSRLREVRRAEWIDVARKHGSTFLRGIKIYDYDKSSSGYDICTAVDLAFACYNSYPINHINSREIERHIINSIGKTEAFFIRVCYPTKKDLVNMLYLANQKMERYARAMSIIPKIHKKVCSLITKDELDKLIEKSPKEILINGRLKGDPKTSVPAPRTIKPYNGTTELYFGNHPDKKLDIQEQADYKKARMKEMRAKLNKKGVERFEIVSPNLHRCIHAQIMGIIYFENYAANGNWSESRFYNGARSIRIPAYGTQIIDHLDEDKTPYAFGDLGVLVDTYQGHPYYGDIANFFVRITTHNGQERIVKLERVEDRFFSGRRREKWWIEHSLRGRVAERLLDEIKYKPTKSIRTKNTYYRRHVVFNVSIDSIKEMWNDFKDIDINQM